MADDFRAQVREALKKLNREETVYYAWVCAVRALPFLGAGGNFNYWKPEDRQKHLQAAFYALDINRGLSGGGARAAFDAAFDAAAFDPFDAAAVNAAARAAYNAAHAAYDAAHAAYDAARNARDAYTHDLYYVLDPFDPFDTADAYAYAYAAYAANAAYAAYAINNDFRLYRKILLYDIDDIYNDKSLNTNLTIYGGIWDKFQKALQDENCAYWGKLYLNIFKTGFQRDKLNTLDKKALDMRLNLPPEIRNRGAAAVANYIEELERGEEEHVEEEHVEEERLNEARIIILGEKGAGKTCLARRLIRPDSAMTEPGESTAGVDTTLWKLEEDDINVHIWDFAGHTITHAVHQFFLSERCLYILVYDGRTEERNRLDYWLEHMKMYGGEKPQVFILINKRDQHTPEIPLNSLNEKYLIAGVYDFSIQDDKAELEVFRETIAGYIKDHLLWNKKNIPLSYYQVKKELEQLFDRKQAETGKERITYGEFERIALRNNIKNSKELLRNLHELGICLWYEKIEDLDTLVLNPEWISQGVYKIINWVHEQKKHEIALTDFVEVFKDDAARYPESQHPFIFKLMIHYELAFKTKKGGSLIIPHLLHEDRPKVLPDFPIGESLMVRYKAEQPLLPNTISRFIVRRNEDIQKSGNNYVVWRYGVVLEDRHGNIALVRETDRTISVSVKGNTKTAYLDELRTSLNEIFESYKDGKPEQQYQVVEFGEITTGLARVEPTWLSGAKVWNHYNAQIPYYEDTLGRFVDLAKMVGDYNINIGNLTINQGNWNDNSVHKTFNFQNCNINLQGSLNDLAGSLKRSGDIEDAEILEEAAEALDVAEACKTPEEVKKKGVLNKLKRIIEDLGDEDSKLHKTIEGIKKGIDIAQDIAKGYNDIAQWAGLPQVPKPFLKKE